LRAATSNGAAVPDRPAERPDLAAATIRVTGTGRVNVRPDIADLRLGVTITAKTVAAAREANGAAMSAVIDALRAMGIAEDDIQTANLNLSPAYDYSANTNPPRLVGYTYTNTVAVTLRELAQVARAIDGALEAGATSLESITFRVADPSLAEQQARELAVADARARAETLASAADVRITGVATIEETGNAMPVPMYKGEMAAMAARDASTPVEAGTNEIAVTVWVTYRIE
jgi:uncharacterized protein YggE